MCSFALVPEVGGNFFTVVREVTSNLCVSLGGAFSARHDGSDDRPFNANKRRDRRGQELCCGRLRWSSRRQRYPCWWK